MSVIRLSLLFLVVFNGELCQFGRAETNARVENGDNLFTERNAVINTNSSDLQPATYETNPSTTPSSSRQTNYESTNQTRSANGSDDEYEDQTEATNYYYDHISTDINTNTNQARHAISTDDYEDQTETTNNYYDRIATDAFGNYESFTENDDSISVKDIFKSNYTKQDLKGVDVIRYWLKVTSTDEEDSGKIAITNVPINGHIHSVSELKADNQPDVDFVSTTPFIRTNIITHNQKHNSLTMDGLQNKNNTVDTFTTEKPRIKDGIQLTILNDNSTFDNFLINNTTLKYMTTQDDGDDNDGEYLNPSDDKYALNYMTTQDDDLLDSNKEDKYLNPLDDKYVNNYLTTNKNDIFGQDLYTGGNLQNKEFTIRDDVIKSQEESKILTSNKQTENDEIQLAQVKAQLEEVIQEEADIQRKMQQLNPQKPETDNLTDVEVITTEVNKESAIFTKLETTSKHAESQNKLNIVQNNKETENDEDAWAQVKAQLQKVVQEGSAIQRKIEQHNPQQPETDKVTETNYGIEKVKNLIATGVNEESTFFTTPEIKSSNEPLQIHETSTYGSSDSTYNGYITSMHPIGENSLEAPIKNKTLHPKTSKIPTEVIINLESKKTEKQPFKNREINIDITVSGTMNLDDSKLMSTESGILENHEINSNTNTSDIPYKKSNVAPIEAKLINTENQEINLKTNNSDHISNNLAHNRTSKLINTKNHTLENQEVDLNINNFDIPFHKSLILTQNKTGKLINTENQPLQEIISSNDNNGITSKPLNRSINEHQEQEATSPKNNDFQNTIVNPLYSNNAIGSDTKFKTINESSKHHQELKPTVREITSSTPYPLDTTNSKNRSGESFAKMSSILISTSDPLETANIDENGNTLLTPKPAYSEHPIFLTSTIHPLETTVVEDYKDKIIVSKSSTEDINPLLISTFNPLETSNLDDNETKPIPPKSLILTTTNLLEIQELMTTLNPFKTSILDRYESKPILSKSSIYGLLTTSNLLQTTKRSYKLETENENELSLSKPVSISLYPLETATVDNYADMITRAGFNSGIYSDPTTSKPVFIENNELFESTSGPSMADDYESIFTLSKPESFESENVLKSAISSSETTIVNNIKLSPSISTPIIKSTLNVVQTTTADNHDIKSNLSKSAFIETTSVLKSTRNPLEITTTGNSKNISTSSNSSSTTSNLLTTTSYLLQTTERSYNLETESENELSLSKPVSISSDPLETATVDNYADMITISGFNSGLYSGPIEASITGTSKNVSTSSNSSAIITNIFTSTSNLLQTTETSQKLLPKMTTRRIENVGTTKMAAITDKNNIKEMIKILDKLEKTDISEDESFSSGDNIDNIYISTTGSVDTTIEDSTVVYITSNKNENFVINMAPTSEENNTEEIPIVVNLIEKTVLSAASPVKPNIVTTGATDKLMEEITGITIEEATSTISSQNIADLKSVSNAVEETIDITTEETTNKISLQNITDEKSVSNKVEKTTGITTEQAINKISSQNITDEKSVSNTVEEPTGITSDEAASTISSQNTTDEESVSNTVSITETSRRENKTLNNKPDVLPEFHELIKIQPKSQLLSTTPNSNIDSYTSELNELLKTSQLLSNTVNAKHDLYMNISKYQSTIAENSTEASRNQIQISENTLKVSQEPLESSTEFHLSSTTSNNNTYLATRRNISTINNIESSRNLEESSKIPSKVSTEFQALLQKESHLSTASPNININSSNATNVTTEFRALLEIPIESQISSNTVNANTDLYTTKHQTINNITESSKHHIQMSKNTPKVSQELLESSTEFQLSSTTLNKNTDLPTTTKIATINNTESSGNKEEAFESTSKVFTEFQGLLTTQTESHLSTATPNININSSKPEFTSVHIVTELPSILQNEKYNNATNDTTEFPPLLEISTASQISFNTGNTNTDLYTTKRQTINNISESSKYHIEMSKITPNVSQELLESSTDFQLSSNTLNMYTTFSRNQVKPFKTTTKVSAEFQELPSTQTESYSTVVSAQLQELKAKQTEYHLSTAKPNMNATFSKPEFTSGDNVIENITNGTTESRALPEIQTESQLSSTAHDMNTKVLKPEDARRYNFSEPLNESKTDTTTFAPTFLDVLESQTEFQLPSSIININTDFSADYTAEAVNEISTFNNSKKDDTTLEIFTVNPIGSKKPKIGSLLDQERKHQVETTVNLDAVISEVDSDIQKILGHVETTKQLNVDTTTPLVTATRENYNPISTTTSENYNSTSTATTQNYNSKSTAMNQNFNSELNQLEEKRETADSKSDEISKLENVSTNASHNNNKLRVQEGESSEERKSRYEENYKNNINITSVDVDSTQTTLQSSGTTSEEIVKTTRVMEKENIMEEEDPKIKYEEGGSATSENTSDLIFTAQPVNSNQLFKTSETPLPKKQFESSAVNFQNRNIKSTSMVTEIVSHAHESSTIIHTPVPTETPKKVLIKINNIPSTTNKDNFNKKTTINSEFDSTNAMISQEISTITTPQYHNNNYFTSDVMEISTTDRTAKPSTVQVPADELDETEHTTTFSEATKSYFDKLSSVSNYEIKDSKTSLKDDMDLSRPDIMSSSSNKIISNHSNDSVNIRERKLHLVPSRGSESDEFSSTNAGENESTVKIDDSTEPLLENKKHVSLRRIIGSIRNTYGEVCLHVNLSARINLNNTIVEVPDDAVVKGNCSHSEQRVLLSWKSRMKPDHNNTIYFVMKVDGNNYYISYIKMNLYDKFKKELIRQEMDDLKVLEMDHKTPTRSENITFHNNVTLEFIDANISPHVLEPIGDTFSLADKQALALQITSGILCLLFVLGGIGIYVYKKMKSKTRIFKVELDK